MQQYVDGTLNQMDLGWDDGGAPPDEGAADEVKDAAMAFAAQVQEHLRWVADFNLRPVNGDPMESCQYR